MLFTFPSPASTISGADVAAAERAERRLALAVERLQQVETDAVRLAEATSWHSRGGREFRDAAQRWCDDVAGAAAQAEVLRDDTARQALRLQDEAEWG